MIFVLFSCVLTHNLKDYTKLDTMLILAALLIT